MKHHLNKQVVIELVLRFHSYEKSRWTLKYWSTYISNECKKYYFARQKTNTKTKPPTFSHIFSISHQTYTTNFTLDYHNSITQNQPSSKIWEGYHTRWWSTIHESHLTKTTRDHEDDGIMETEGDFWRREFIRRHCVLCFIFYRGCVIINVSFRN